MTRRKELVDRISDKVYEMTGQRYYLHDIDTVLDAFIYVVEQALVNEETVKMHGFGVFSVITRKAHTRYSPLRKEQVFVEERKRIRFTPGDLLKRSVNEGVIRFERISEVSNAKADDAEE